MSFFVIQEDRTKGFFMKFDKYGASYWSCSPFIAHKFKSQDEATDYLARYIGGLDDYRVIEIGRGC